jgi:hypothetical protein
MEAITSCNKELPQDLKDATEENDENLCSEKKCFRLRMDPVILRVGHTH